MAETYTVFGCEKCLSHAPPSSLPDPRTVCGLCGGAIIPWDAARIRAAEDEAERIERERKEKHSTPVRRQKAS